MCQVSINIQFNTTRKRKKKLSFKVWQWNTSQNVLQNVIICRTGKCVTFT